MMSFHSSFRPAPLRGLFLLLLSPVLTSLSVGATTDDLCKSFKPPYGPVNYTDMPFKEGQVGYGNYKNLPFQNTEDNIMFCNSGDTSNSTVFRYFNSHISEMYPTKIAPRGTGPIHKIPKVKKLKYHMRKIEKLQNFTQLYNRVVTDALLVIHKGKIYYEKYEEPHYSEMQTHMVFSMTKSYVGIIAAMLAAEGVFDPDKTVSYYLPELSDPINANISYGGDNSHYDEMTVRNLMDMSASTSYYEKDESLKLLAYAMAYNSDENFGGTGFRNLPLAYGKDSSVEQGYKFRYKTLDTTILGMVLESEKVLNGNGKVWEYFYDNIWSKLGQESHISIMVDWQKHPHYGAGSQVIARDAARFGLMMLNNGKNMNGDQIVPEEVVRDIANGGTELNKIQMNRAKPVYANFFDAYRNQFWVQEAGKKYAQAGVYGQYCHIDIEKDLVIVKFGSYKDDTPNDGNFYAQLELIASYFEGGTPKGKKSKKKSKTTKKRI